MTGEDSKELVALREALRNEQADYESWEFYHAPENGSRESERRERRERSYPQRVASERLHRLDRLRQLRTRVEVLEREKAIQDSKTSIADQIQKSIQDILSNPEVAPSGPLVSLDTLETILMRHPVYGYQDEPVSPEEGGTRIPGAVRFLNEAYSSDFAVRHGLLADLMVSFQRAAARHPVVKNDDCLHLLVLLVYRLGLPTYDKTGKPATFPDELSASLNLSARWARLSEVDATLCRYGWPALPIEHSLSPTVPQDVAIAPAATDSGESAPDKNQPKKPKKRVTERGKEHEKWKECADKIQQERNRSGKPAFKKYGLALEVIDRLKLNDSIETVRKRI